MDQKLVLCLTSLREEAEAVRAGAMPSDLNSLISDVFDLCKQAVSDEDVSFCIDVLFDKESGIFNVVELLMTIKERTVVKAREMCCMNLADFIGQSGDRFLPHAPAIQEKCLSVFRRDDSKVVQAAALAPLLSMLDSNAMQKNSSSFRVDWSMAEMILQEYRKAKTSGNLRSNILILLGDLFEYFPAKFDEKNVTILLKICLDTLDEQLKTNKDPVFVLVSGVMKCLDSLLTWYDASLPAGGSVETSNKLYTFLRQVIFYREDMKRYESVKAGLRLLSRHAGLFALRLVQDSKEILSWLQTYCTHANAPLRDVGFSAFNQFIYQVSQCLVKESRVQNAQAIYKHFMAVFFEILDAQYMDSKLLLALAVRGLGRMSPSIVKFSGKETLHQVFHRLKAFGGSTSKSGEDRDYLLGHSDALIGAFADIVIHLDNVEDFMVNFIAEVTGNIFYQFPQLFPKQKKAIYSSLSMLFKSLYLKGTIFSFFLTNIVWSSLERTMESSDPSGGTGLPLWPQYAELWSQLLDISAQVTDQGVLVQEKDDACSEIFACPDGEELKVDLKQFQEFIFDKIIECTMKILKELNLKYRVRAIDNQKPSDSDLLQDDEEAIGVEPETEMDLIEPLNLVHMHKYLNLVEFIQDLLSRPYAHLFLRWVYPFGSLIMELSNHAAEKVPKAPTEEQILCTTLFRRYLNEVLVASRRYKLELLASCLQLCLSAPPALIDIQSLVVSMQTALKIGLRYPQLASVTIDGLERWHHLYPRELEVWLPGIVPYLSDYLTEVEKIEVSDAAPSYNQSDDSSRLPEGVASSGNLSRAQVARLRQARAKQNQPGPFEVIQIRVQKFLGKIGYFNHYLVPEVNLLQVVGSGGLAWDTVDRVQFTFPFRDEKHDVWLDSLLPRVVELALSSSDRKTKVTASELLQALCMVMLGNSAKGPVRRKNETSHSVHLDKIYKRLFPAILRLAVDVELVTRQLFNEFARQLIHWYTSNQQKENPETVALLDAILDGLVDAENGSLREFCAACFAEFMSWSVRHAPPESNDFVNVKSILRRLYNRMDHPNPYNRLGASMAAYRIYPVLRGTPSIVDRYILEMIFFCIKSLRLAETDDNQIGTVKQLNKTLDSYLKLVERNIGVLQCVRKDRQVFLNLESFLEWLLQQTRQLQQKCRSKCMGALSFICRALPVASLAGWFRSGSNHSTMLRNCIQALDFHADSLSENIEFSLDEAHDQLSVFIRSFHWFTWALKDALITAEELKMNTKSGLLVMAFLQRIVRAPESSLQWNAVTPGQREAYQKLNCIATIHFLGFAKQILDSEFGNLKKGLFMSRDLAKGIVNIAVLSDLIPVGESRFHELMCLALLRPRDLGFVMTNPHQSEELARLALGVMQMLTVVSEGFKLGLTKRLQGMFKENKSKYDLSAMNLSLDTFGNEGALGLEDATSLLKGYQQLHLSGSLLPVLGKEEGKKMGESILMRVVDIRRECPPVLESIASEMLSLSIALGVRVQRLLEVCLDETIINSPSNARKVTTGGIFYLNFRKVIVRQVKFAFNDCYLNLLNAALKNPTARLLLNAVLDDYIGSTNHSKNLSLGSFLEQMLSHLQLLQPCGTPSSGLADKQFLLEIFHKLLLLDTSFDLLQQNQSTLQFIEDTYISFLSAPPHLDSSSTVSSSQKDANFALKSQSLMLIPYFFEPRFSQYLQSRIAGALTKVVSDHLLIRESDLHGNSHQRSNYLQILIRLLNSVSLSRNLLLLEVTFPLLLHPPKLLVRKLSETLDQFAEIIGERRQDAFDLCIRILNDDTKLPQLRRAVIEKVFLALVNGAPVDFVATWYSARIENFVEMLEKRPSTADADTEEEGLVSKICHYHLVEQLFLKVDAPMIKETITPLVPNALLIKQTMSESRAKNDPVKLFPVNSSLWRELHIAAYNCLAAIALRTQEQEKIFSVVLFKEGTAGMIWQHLIDTEKVYDNLAVETTQLNFASQTVREMRAMQKARTRTGTVGASLSTLSSQYFAGAGLSQEPALINTFVSRAGLSEARSDNTSLGMSLNVEVDVGSVDATSVDPSPLNESDGSPEAVVDRLDLDQDDFDLHPCMSVVLRLILSLHARFGTGLGDMPEWMKGLHSTMQNAATQLNTRLFLTKVVIKSWKVFTPYCQSWFVPLVQTILLDPAKSGGMNFHYMLRDICITILQWKFARPPDAGVASTFVNHLISVAAHGSSQVLRANVDIIRLFVGSWKEDLQLEKGIILNYLCAGGKAASSSDRVVKMQRIVGLQLLGAIVVSDLPMYDPVSDVLSEKELYLALLQNLSFRGKEVYEASGELIGIALKQRKAAEESMIYSDEQVLEVPLRQCLLNFVRDSNLDCFLNVLNKITLRYPQYIESFASVLIDMLPKLPGVFKTIALDILLRYPACIPSLLNMLLPSLNKLLIHRDEVAQLRSLHLLMELVKHKPDKRISESVIPVLCETFATHENVDCRQQYYDILICLYKQDGVSTDRLIVRSLLAGLIDNADDVRQRVQNFWHTQLSENLGLRLTQMINEMYDPTVEEYWAQFTNALLLKLCEDSVDFTRPIFNAPLSDCVFHEQTINTAWSGSSLPMTPLFSQSQKDLQGSQESLSQVILSSQEGNATVPRGAHMIRATFTSTLTQSQAQDTIASSMQGSQESALFAMSRRATGTQRGTAAQDSMTLDDSTVPQRRVLQPNAARSQIIRGVANAHRRREARAAQQAAERGNKVHMMRRYRIGELPDIEIKYEDILTPLAALAQKDSIFARLLLTLVCRAVYANSSTAPVKNKHGDIKSSMKKGIEKALESTHHGISFVGCLEALCMEDSEIWIQPKLIGSACLKSTNFHSGIVVLEMEILNENSKQGASLGTSSKRHKGASGTPTPEKTNLEDAWLELARLYRELGEDDVVLSVYQTNLTKEPITHQALEAQLGGDSSRGLILYDKALDDNPEASGIEQDIWYNQRLVCLADLNKWDMIVDDALVQISDADDSSELQKLWGPRVREPYLGLFMRGAVKVATYRSNAADFVQISWEEPSKRDILIKQYGSQLALLAVVNDQLDRARFLLSNCYRLFRKQWSALHPLAIGARHRQLQKLQKLVELDEFADMMAGQQLTEIPRKLQEWRHRWPSSKDDGVEVWDDIVQNRLIFFHKFQGMVNKQLSSETDDVKRTFASKLDEERAHIFRQAASGLTKQGAYSVAQKYMEEYTAARQGSGKKDRLDYESIKGLVKLRCLQASRVQIAQASESTRMLWEVLRYIKSNAQKPGVELNPMVRMGCKLLEASASVQLALSNLGCLPKTDPSPSAVKECLSLLGAAYVAYSDAFSNQRVAPEPSVDPKTLRGLAKTSLKFGQFCDELLKSTKNVEWSNDVRTGIIRGDSNTGLPPASTYPALIVKHMMKAATLDTSLRAQHGVARTLSLIGQYPETHADFLDEVKKVPIWVFIPWIPQMLAVMDQEEGELLVGLLEEIARVHPQALYFSFHVSEKDFGPIGQKRTQTLANLLKNDYMQGFVRALEDLTFPEQRLRDGLAQIKNCLTGSNREKAKHTFAYIVEDCLDADAMTKTSRQSGEYNCKFARDWSKRVQKAFGEDGAKLSDMDERGFMTAVNDLMGNLQKAMRNLQTGVMSLAHLSKWMAKFDQSISPTIGRRPSAESGLLSSWSESSGSDKEFTIEIPGQYNGFHEPGHLSHVKLVGFDQTLISLSSKQRPKVVTMRGSDEKEYKFVVKGGEDIRLDQRIEQLFDVMNSILQRDSVASQRGLRVRTYAVVPVSKSCGLLQFVENTCVLEDVVKDGLISKRPELGREGKDAATAFLSKLRTQQHEWIAKRGGSSKTPYESYTNLYKKADFDEINHMLTSIQSQLPWDTFRAGVSRWATSAESYLALRSQFAKSLSVVSICGYIAGVGDRHLANTLVDMRSGSLVPIDFGYSFGTGVILLPVPELIPFRLTNQLTNFLLPLDALGLLRTDMVHTLSALIQSRDTISAVMDVFVKEPLVDWKNEAMKTNSIRGKKSGSDEMEANLEQQYVELKVENAQRKLQLWNPAAITIAELHSSIHANKPYLPALQEIVKGTPTRNIRARINGQKCKSVQEQVDCLIDQATDPNLLGRLWTGWQAWV